MGSGRLIHALRLPRLHTYDDIVGKMTQDLDLDGYKLFWSSLIEAYADGARVIFQRRDIGDKADIVARICYFVQGVHCDSTVSRIRLTRSDTAAKMYFETKYPVEYTIVATLQNAGYLEIQRAGDIIFLDDKKLQWSDVNLYRHVADVLQTDDDFHLEGGRELQLHSDSGEAGVIHFRSGEIDFAIRQDSAHNDELAFLTESAVGNEVFWITRAGGIILGADRDVNLYRGAANVLKTDDLLDAVLGFQVNGVAGVDGTFTSDDGKTITVTKGIITSIV